MRYVFLILGLITIVGCAPAHKTGSGTSAVALAKQADQLVKIDTVETLNDAAMRHVKLVGDKKPKLVLNDPTNSEYPRRGVWMSGEQETDFPFTQMIASWNVKCPPGTGIRFFVRVREKAKGYWSPWLYTGYWGHPSPANCTIKFPGGWVDEDTLKLSRPAAAWQIKAVLESLETDVKINPSIRRISVTYSGKVSDPELLEKLSSPTTHPSTMPAVIDLPVPYRAQGDAPKAMRSQVCSPTSVTMVLAYWGKDYPIATNCQAMWDEDYHMFGNWNRAVARAGEVGLDAWVTHFRNWQQVRATLATGQPIIASIKFKKGEFSSSVLSESAGHLIVIRGMTANGDLICNDPGKRGRGNHVIYKAADMERAWFAHGGVAYIIHGNHPAS
jgi:Peptidase_C39 like family